MKKLFLIFFVALMVASGNTLAQTETKQEITPVKNAKILIAYYSWSGNTKEVAQKIHDIVGGDMFEIQTVSAYPQDYRETTTQAKKEIANGFRPELTSKVADITQYNTVFVGSPNWWGTIAPAVSTFLETTGLSGKTIIPFITHGGGGVQNTVSNLTAQCQGCLVEKTPWVGYGNRTAGIDSWLKDLGYIE